MVVVQWVVCKRWIDIVEECLKKRGLEARQERRMVQDKSEWWRFVRGNNK